MEHTDPTFVELAHAGLEKIEVQAIRARKTYVTGAALRELALARTALEDAQMRFTRALALIEDKFHPADLEKEST